jgi:murein L,D-transpeptidase YafK
MKILALILTIISFSVFAKIDLVKVDKSENKMYLTENGQIIKEYHVAFGGSPKGHKQREGDQKTPEGIYTLDYKKEDSSFYRAMHVSYPNPIDLAYAQKNGFSAGGFIMVHGQKNGLGWLSSITQQFNWTDGCIALTNKEMDEFMSLVKVGTKIQIQW